MYSSSSFFFILSIFVVSVVVSIFSTTVLVNAVIVPPYQAITLQGKVVSMPDFRGKVILLNTWATWCDPCRTEIPFLESLYKNYSSNGLDVIGVSIDSAVSNFKIKPFMQNYKMTYTVLRDPDNRFSHVFATTGVPETLLIGRDGTILYHWKGPIDANPQDVDLKVKNALGLEGKNTRLSTTTQNNHQTIGVAVAFIAGLLSFLSPCVLPLIPSYVTFITGLSLKEMTTSYSTLDNPNIGNRINDKNSSASRSILRTKTTVITRGCLFILGFSIVFIILGSSVAIAGSLVTDSAVWIARIGGIVIVLFGLNMLGILRIPRLERQFKHEMSKKPKYVGSFVVGMTFGAGWTPCIGPILAGILTLAASSSSIISGTVLLTAYSAGLAVPFIISAVAIDRFLLFFKRIKKWIPWIEKASAILLISIGVLLLTGSFGTLSSIFGGGII